MLVTLLGPDSKVAKREDFEKLGIPTYLSPSACSTVTDAQNATGSKDTGIYGLRESLVEHGYALSGNRRSGPHL